MKQLYLRLKFGYGDEKCDYKLYHINFGYRLEKNNSFSKNGSLEELKDFYGEPIRFGISVSKNE